MFVKPFLYPLSLNQTSAFILLLLVSEYGLSLLSVTPSASLTFLWCIIDYRHLPPAHLFTHMSLHLPPSPLHPSHSSEQPCQWPKNLDLMLLPKQLLVSSACAAPWFQMTHATRPLKCASAGAQCDEIQQDALMEEIALIKERWWWINRADD